jgi:ferrochelatase
MVKKAIVLYNLGGPDKLDSVKPFLFNLFNDKHIIAVPQPFRYMLAKLISTKRNAEACAIYQHLGGKSTIMAETQAQARDLQQALTKDTENEYKVFIAMRYWHPMADEVAQQVKEYQPDEIVLLPLYPQMSTTTTMTFEKTWHKAARKAGIAAIPMRKVCCYPENDGFIRAYADLIKEKYQEAKKQGIKPRILFSAHGVPVMIIKKGDPYQWQVERSVAKIVEELDMADLDYKICYQSKVGPLEWLTPATDKCIEEAGQEGKGLIVVPVAFVSEHSETLVELDIEYGELAHRSKVPLYLRVPTVSTHPDYINALANLCVQPQQQPKVCPAEFCKCVNQA